MLPNNHKREMFPPPIKYYVTRSTPIKPVRVYYPPTWNTNYSEFNYYSWEYSIADPNVFIPPTNCTQIPSEKMPPRNMLPRIQPMK
jgi:hypothetical protein